MHTKCRTENLESIKPGPSPPTCLLYNTNFLMRHPSFLQVSTNVLCFLSNIQNSPVHHNTIVFFFFLSNCPLLGDGAGWRAGTDRPLSFYVTVDGVSNGCHACPRPQPCLTFSAQHFIIYLSNCLTLLFGLRLVYLRLTCSITFTFVFSAEISSHSSHMEKRSQISLSVSCSLPLIYWHFQHYSLHFSQ